MGKVKSQKYQDNHYYFSLRDPVFGLLYLHNGVGRQDSLLHAGLLRGAPHHSEVAHGELGRDGLPRARFATYDNGLILFLPKIIDNYPHNQ